PNRRSDQSHASAKCPAAKNAVDRASNANERRSTLPTRSAIADASRAASAPVAESQNVRAISAFTRAAESGSASSSARSIHPWTSSFSGALFHIAERTAVWNASSAYVSAHVLRSRHVFSEFCIAVQN